MKQKDSKLIQREVNTHYSEYYYSGWEGESIRFYHQDIVHKMPADLEFVIKEAKEEFKEIKNNFVVPEKDREYNSTPFILRMLPHHAESASESLLRTKRVSEGYRLEYYAGSSLDEVVFMGLTISLEFYYNKKFKELSELAKKSGEPLFPELKEIADKFWETGSFSPVVLNQKYTKETAEKVDDLSDYDEYTTIRDSTFIINMRLFDVGSDTSKFSEFLAYTHERVKRLDLTLERLYSTEILSSRIEK